MPILAFLEIAMQVFFAVHAVRTGRDRWLWLIIVFPLVGGLVYFFVEFLPDLRHQPVTRKAGSGLSKLLDPGRELRQLRDQLARTDSINNRKALADDYVRAGLFKDAIDLYQTCLKGTYVDDPGIMEGLSLAHFFQEDYAGAKKHLLRLKEIQAEKTPHEFKLLLARTYEELGEQENAVDEYTRLLRLHSGEEARCRYALLLKKLGRTAEARNLFNAIINETRIQPKFYRKAQKKWVEMAQREM
jgi:hypothetical protein